jgi:tRNA(His) guanylyltransferase
MEDALGSRMKENYENRTRLMLPRRTYTIIRLDGKAFHTFTRGFKRPYDMDLMKLMDKTAVALCNQIQGAKMAYVQSDEISVLLTDFDSIQTDAWFDGNVQKITSISASIATLEFRKQIGKLMPEPHLFDKEGNYKPAFFDSRVFTISDVNEVVNYFIWRQQDATRNSVQMGAQALYSHKELNKKNTSDLQEMMFQKGINWNDYPVGFKRGRMILKEKIELVQVFPRVSAGLDETGSPIQPQPIAEVERKKWDSFEPPIFTQEPEFLLNRLPKIGEVK